MDYTKKAKNEQSYYKLTDNDYYNAAIADYVQQYNKRPPHKDIPTKHMIKALRLMPWENTCEDWARLHVTEMFLRA